LSQYRMSGARGQAGTGSYASRLSKRPSRASRVNASQDVAL
jgi:hypothetical protein